MVTRRIARNENQGKPIGAPDQPRPAIFASTRSKASAPALHQSRSSEPARPPGRIAVPPATHSPRACHHLLRSQPRRIGFGSPPGTRLPCGSTANYHAPLSKPAKTGTFYFAQIRNFLFCLDRKPCPVFPIATHHTGRSVKEKSKKTKMFWHNENRQSRRGRSGRGSPGSRTPRRHDC